MEEKEFIRRHITSAETQEENAFKKQYLAEISSVIRKGPYKAAWSSLSTWRVPEWFRYSKFGIFIHWGIYSVPAFDNEWYSRNMYVKDSRAFSHHVQTYGSQKEFGYKDFIPLFKAEKFDPDAWADLFTAAGAKYVVPVAEHHDGFQMYKSRVSHWNAAELGPHRDVLKEIEESCRRKNLFFCASSHRFEHWFFMGEGRKFDSDITDKEKPGDFYWPAVTLSGGQDLYAEPAPTKEYMEDWLVRCCELVDNYRPALVYFDWWIQQECLKPYLQQFAAYYYNRAAHWGFVPVICYKHDAFMFGSALVDIERGQFPDTVPFTWESDTAVARNSWCYTTENVYKSAPELVCTLLDVVSKNGNLLLDIGPKADGTIPAEDERLLRSIGAWLKVNGEAVYGSHIWRRFGEGPVNPGTGQFTDSTAPQYTKDDWRFTVNGGCLYASCLKFPEDGCVTVKSLAEADASHLPVFSGIIRNITALGFPQKVSSTRDSEGLHIQAQGIHSDMPVVFRIELE